MTRRSRDHGRPAGDFFTFADPWLRGMGEARNAYFEGDPGAVHVWELEPGDGHPPGWYFRLGGTEPGDESAPEGPYVDSAAAVAFALEAWES